jgi:hypothetical protein
VKISRDYPLKTRTSKQPIKEISEYEIIPSYPLKYPKSKKALLRTTTHLDRHRGWPCSHYSHSHIHAPPACPALTEAAGQLWARTARAGP